jgi:imidazolonepropionase-like amidohydrolase
VSRDAGEFLHFSGDGKRLHWALGPDLYTRELKDAFSFLTGAPQTLPPPPETGVAIGFEAPYDAPEGTLALVGGRVITMRQDTLQRDTLQQDTLQQDKGRKDEVIEDGVVVVRGSRILAVGKRGEVQVPAGARVVDVSGKTVMPGLVDVHWHGAMGSDGITPEQSWVHFASLGFGVTTVHDPSNDTGEVFAASELAKAGLTTSPRIFSTGTILYGASGHFRAPIETLDDARSHLRRLKAVGAFSVKSYNQPRRDQRQKVLQAARELQMMVVPEGGSLLQHNLTMVVDGHTGVEHSLPVEKVYEDVLQLWSRSDAGYTPTLGVAYGGLTGEYYWYQKTDVWANKRLLTYVPRRIIDARSRRRTMAPEEEFNHIAVAKVAKRLTDRGVSVQLGAHGQREGLAAHWEMWMFQQGGMTPHEALRAGTLNGARYLGLDKDLGSLEVGKLADLIVIDGNPLQDIRQSERVQYTMVGGRLYDAATMDEVGLRPRKRQPFFFEREGNEGWAPTTHVFSHED